MTQLVFDKHFHIMPVAALLFSIGAFVIALVFYQPVELVELFKRFHIVHRSSSGHRLCLKLFLFIRKIARKAEGLDSAISGQAAERCRPNVSAASRLAFSFILHCLEKSYQPAKPFKPHLVHSNILATSAPLRLALQPRLQFGG